MLVRIVCAEKNWDTYPDKNLSEKIGLEKFTEVFRKLKAKVDIDELQYYPFVSIYDEEGIKGVIPKPTGKLAEEIEDWDLRARGLKA